MSSDWPKWWAGSDTAHVLNALALLLDLRDVDGVYGEDGVDGVVAGLADRLGSTARTHPSLVARREALFAQPALAEQAVPILPGSGATNMVIACARCQVRFPPAGSCPRCRGTTLFDLRDVDERRHLLRLIVRGGSPAPRSHSRSIAGVGGLTSLGFLIYLLATGAGLGNAIAGFLVVAVIAVPLAVVLAGVLGDRTPNVDAKLTPLPAVAALPSGVMERVSGRVHVRRGVRSPTGVACAASRVRGTGPGGELDDAGVGAFDLYEEGRPLARIEVDQAFLDLGASATPAVRPIADALEDFLRARGRVPDGATCTLAEDVLVEGDTAEVVGAAVRGLVSDGMRGSTAVVVFAEWPSIRKA